MLHLELRLATLVEMKLNLRLGAVVGTLAAAGVVRGAACPSMDPPQALASPSSPTANVPVAPAPPSSNFTKIEGQRAANCFPAPSFNMPKSFLPESVEDWWCDQRNEYAFLGFSYEVTACELSSCRFCVADDRLAFWTRSGQSLQQLRSDFQNIRNRFHGRYVRLYGACDQNGF